MTKYWAIAPYERRYITQWENVWRWNLQNGHITLGWGIGRDPSLLSEEALLKAVRKHKADRSQRSQEIIHRMIWNFYHEIKQGHIVIARRGLSEVAAIGTVRKIAYFDLKKSRTMPSEEQFENFLDVDWHDEPRDLKFNRQVFSQYTVMPISEEKYVSLLEEKADGKNSSLNASDINVPPGREEIKAYRIIRDTNLSRKVKALHSYQCQLCNYTMVLPDGSHYSEAHHIRPLGNPHNGPDAIENILCLCPNHHAELDYGVYKIKLTDLTMITGHKIGADYINYHNTKIFKRIKCSTNQSSRSLRSG